MSNIHLHNTIQHAFAALMQVQTSHLCIVILSRTSCTHHHHQRRRQWIIFAVPTETKLGSTTFRFGSEHQRKMSSIDPATEQSRLCESRRSVSLGRRWPGYRSVLLALDLCFLRSRLVLMGCTIRHGPPSHRSLFGYNNQKRCFEVGEDRQTLFKVDRPVTGSCPQK